MYPFLRVYREFRQARRAPPLAIGAPHISQVRCMPWDLDVWKELNNGRTLTLFDLGRVPMMMRTGIFSLIREKGWGLTVAGNTTRYRRRVVMFDRLEMVSRIVGWDEKFLYVEQSLWRGGECTSHVVSRSAFTSPGGMIGAEKAMAALGHAGPRPELPGWVRAWIAADAERPWPPAR